MSNSLWINKFRENYGHKTVEFRFEQFLIDHDLTVERLAKLLGYSMNGIFQMLRRGTIKESTLVQLEKIKIDGVAVETKKYLGKSVKRKRRTK